MNGRSQLSTNNLTKLKQSKSTLLDKIDIKSPKINKSYVGLSQEKTKFSRENSLEKSSEGKGILIY